MTELEQLVNEFEKAVRGLSSIGHGVWMAGLDIKPERLMDAENEFKATKEALLTFKAPKPNKTYVLTHEGLYWRSAYTSAWVEDKSKATRFYARTYPTRTSLGNFVELEAESIPRFTEEDLSAICQAVGDRWEHYLDTKNKLRALRKPRDSE